ISREKIALEKLCRTEVDRAKSIAAVELCVGIIDRPARYMWSSLSTVTQRTGTLGIRRTSTMNRESVRALLVARRRSLCATRLRSRRNTSSLVEKLRTYATGGSAVRPRTAFVVTVH